jgi:hypothetical protein
MNLIITKVRPRRKEILDTRRTVRNVKATEQEDISGTESGRRVGGEEELDLPCGQTVDEGCDNDILSDIDNVAKEGDCSDVNSKAGEAEMLALKLSAIEQSQK